VSKGEGTVTLAKPRQLRNHAPEGIAQPSQHGHTQELRSADYY
jgi:hypothetical protein